MRCFVQCCVAPGLVGWCNKTVLEHTQGLMGPNTEELVERHVFWQDAVHATDPAC